MLIDSGAIDAQRVALVGARNLDPPEREFINESGLHTGKHAVARALADVDCVYVALDADALDEGVLASHFPEAGGLTLDETERVLRSVRDRGAIVGAGFTGLAPDPDNVEPLTRLGAALGL
jgi:arginase family enzyme